MARELLKGNQAVAEAAVRAGLQTYFGYPITPQTELLEWLAVRMPELGRAFVQAESELGAINMVYGSACTGARVMTSSSSPGTSLMMGLLLHAHRTGLSRSWRWRWRDYRGKYYKDSGSGNLTFKIALVSAVR